LALQQPAIAAPAFDCIRKHRTTQQCTFNTLFLKNQQCRRLNSKDRAVQESSYESPKTLGKILSSWKDEVARTWRFSKSNGITEGFHRKMKLIQRRAYGFRNFENYRVRVKVLCG
jgi:transposase